MNYANLGFCQIDMSGAYVNVVSEQQMVAGTYAKVLEAIKNQKIIVLVNLKTRGDGETGDEALSPTIACATTYEDNDELVVSITCSDVTDKDIVIKSDDTMTEE